MSTATRGGSPRRRGTPTRRSDRRDRAPTSVPVVRGVVHEARELLLEGQLDRAQGAVAVLGDNDVGEALALGLVVVVVVAVDEHHEVVVLLDRARLAQIGQHGLLVGALLDAAV